MKTNKTINLYITIGKTFTKFAIFNLDKIQEENIVTIKTKDLIELKNISKIMDDAINHFDFGNIKKVFLCSVHNNVSEKLKTYFANKDIEAVFLSNENQFSLDLSNLYNPWEMGADLIAQSIYVTHFFNEAIVVSLGTISVIYHVKDNVFIGCLLIPGIQSSLDLFEKILEIKANSPEIQSKVLGLNNHEAISIGLLNTIQTVVDDLSHKLKTKCPVIFTGGNSHYFKDTKWWHIENLDLLGLYIFSKKFINE